MGGQGGYLLTGVAENACRIVSTSLVLVWLVRWHCEVVGVLWLLWAVDECCGRWWPWVNVVRCWWAL